MNIVAAMDDPNLFRAWFPGPSWDPWRIALKAAFALPMTDAEVAFFRTLAQRDPPARRVKEFWVISGRRAGKDSIASLMGAFTAALFDEGDRLRPGERPLLMCLAVDREQAAIVLNYMRRMFTDIPMLAAMVTRETQDGFRLSNGVDVVVSTNSYRAARGRTVLCAIFDEVAFWRSELTSTPDLETYRAVRPGMATLSSTAMLVGISSPHRKAGLLYEKFKKHYGRDDDNVLVIKAPTSVLNPSLDATIISQALEDDPGAAAAEWLAEFRDDISGFADVVAIEAVVDRDITVRPPRPDIMYTSHVDSSGGVRDSFTCAVAHLEADVGVLDCIVEVRAPFNPSDATWQIATTLKSYRLHSTTGDKYGAQWVVDAFAKCGIQYEHCDQDRSGLYANLLPLITSGRLKLLDSKRLVSQLAGLERRSLPSGKTRIDHGVGGFDDVAVSCAGALVRAVSRPQIDWGRALADVQAHFRGRSGFAGVMPGDPDFPHRWNGRHL
jgi:hypothetical protein